MTSPIRRASKKRIPLKIGVHGVSGSGKTYSSLLLAHGLIGDWTKILVIDSEEVGELSTDQTNYEAKKRGSDFYADLGEFSVLPLSPPFTPEKYIRAIDLGVSEGFEVIVIDSGTHAWEGPGGVLDIHNKFGGRFQDWAKANPYHYQFIEKIMKCPAHVFITLRQKSEYAVVQEGPKINVKKMGLKVQQREGFEYDLHITFQIEHETHLATIGKDRTGLFEGRPPFLITQEIGQELKQWNQDN
jgi:hypothetical protein